MRNYVTIGSWNFLPREKGLAVYSWPGMEPLQHILSDVNVGQQFPDRERGVLYTIHESDKQRGGMEPGGNVIALKQNPETGEFCVFSEKPSVGSKPSYIWMDKSREYLVVSHHAGRNPVVKVEKNQQGIYEPRYYYDDTTLVLFRLGEDGSIGAPCDVICYRGTGRPGLHACSHLHSVVANQDSELYIACDKGLDKVYMLRIDRENGRLIQLDEAIAEDYSAPRYAVFHPTLPVVYVNHEEKLYITAYNYDENGKLTFMGKVNLLDEPVTAHDTPSDLVVSRDGKMLYASVRGANRIVAYRLTENGHIQRAQIVSCGGNTPRGLALSADGGCLISCNQDSDKVSMLKIRLDGLLEEPEDLIIANCPGNICFW